MHGGGTGGRRRPPFPMRGEVCVHTPYPTEAACAYPIEHAPAMQCHARHACPCQAFRAPTRAVRGPANRRRLLNAGRLPAGRPTKHALEPVLRCAGPQRTHLILWMSSRCVLRSGRLLLEPFEGPATTGIRHAVGLGKTCAPCSSPPCSSRTARHAQRHDAAPLSPPVESNSEFRPPHPTTPHPTTTSTVMTDDGAFRSSPPGKVNSVPSHRSRGAAVASAPSARVICQNVFVKGGSNCRPFALLSDAILIGSCCARGRFAGIQNAGVLPNSTWQTGPGRGPDTLPHYLFSFFYLLLFLKSLIRGTRHLRTPRDGTARTPSFTFPSPSSGAVERQWGSGEAVSWL
jgi:hypothetical protein